MRVSLWVSHFDFIIPYPANQNRYFHFNTIFSFVILYLLFAKIRNNLQEICDKVWHYDSHILSATETLSKESSK